jgi:hypothetical protein
MQIKTEWLVENLNDEGFVCGDTFATKALALAYRAECEKDGLDVITFREQAEGSV